MEYRQQGNSMPTPQCIAICSLIKQCTLRGQYISVLPSVVITRGKLKIIYVLCWLPLRT
uniref:Uncharacterized protein n=1 Tax=Arundo donax TaxID=35708 RepID=A0A0A9H948_ARUDO